MYLFLATVFLGLQGAAVYRHQIKKLSSEEIVYIKKNLNESATEDFQPLWENTVTDSVVTQTSKDEIPLRSAEEISEEIAGVMESTFADVENVESEIADVASEETEDFAELRKGDS